MKNIFIHELSTRLK